MATGVMAQTGWRADAAGRVHNFNPGPAVLPLPVLEQARDELLNYDGSGMSVLERAIDRRSSRVSWLARKPICARC